MGELLELIIDAVFIKNILLAYFLGMCAFLAVSKRVGTAFGMGCAVVFVMTITTPVNWLLNHYFLQNNALSWAGVENVDLSYLSFIVFIAVIAGITQLVELTLDRFSPVLYAALGIFLPLIAVNCAILGTSLFMVERSYTFIQSVVFGIASGMGWMLAIVSMAAIRKKLEYSNIPHGLNGLGIVMIMAGLMAMAFLCFSGLTL